jgi:hypothetical protein
VTRCAYATETWNRIDCADIAVGWPDDWTVAERDQMEALAEDLNRELLSRVSGEAAGVSCEPQSFQQQANQAHREHMRQMHSRAAAIGWRYISSNSCPRRLIGKHCKGSKCYCCNGNSGTGYRNLDDHGGTWFCDWHWGPHGEKFVLWAPYAARGEYVAELIRVAEQDGLQVHITASVWNPPHTVGIMFHPATAEHSHYDCDNPYAEQVAESAPWLTRNLPEEPKPIDDEDIWG